MDKDKSKIKRIKPGVITFIQFLVAIFFVKTYEVYYGKANFWEYAVIWLMGFFFTEVLWLLFKKIRKSPS